MTNQEINQQCLPANQVLKPGDIVWKVDENPPDGEPFRLDQYEITKIGKIHLWYVRLGVPRKLEPRRALSKDFFRHGIYFSADECLSAFNKVLLARVFAAEETVIRRRNEFFKYRETLGKTC